MTSLVNQPNTSPDPEWVGKTVVDDLTDLLAPGRTRQALRAQTRLLWRQDLERDLADAFEAARAVHYQPGSQQLQDLDVAEARYTGWLQIHEHLFGDG